MNTAVEYLFLVMNKLMGRTIPIRFAIFSLVGAFGVCAHLACLTILIGVFHCDFVFAQICATLTAMTVNFFLNNAITYRDRMLHGVRSGLGAAFVLCCVFFWSLGECDLRAVSAFLRCEVVFRRAGGCSGELSLELLDHQSVYMADAAVSNTCPIAAGEGFWIGNYSLSSIDRLMDLVKRHSILLCLFVLVWAAIVPFGRAFYRFELNYNEGWNVYNAVTVNSHQLLYPRSMAGRR